MEGVYKFVYKVVEVKGTYNYTVMVNDHELNLQLNRYTADDLAHELADAFGGRVDHEGADCDWE